MSSREIMNKMIKRKNPDYVAILRVYLDARVAPDVAYYALDMLRRELLEAKSISELRTSRISTIPKLPKLQCLE